MITVSSQFVYNVTQLALLNSKMSYTYCANAIRNFISNTANSVKTEDSTGHDDTNKDDDSLEWEYEIDYIDEPQEVHVCEWCMLYFENNPSCPQLSSHSLIFMLDAINETDFSTDDNIVSVFVAILFIGQVFNVISKLAKSGVHTVNIGWPDNEHDVPTAVLHLSDFTILPVSLKGLGYSLWSGIKETTKSRDVDDREKIETERLITTSIQNYIETIKPTSLEDL